MGLSGGSNTGDVGNADSARVQERSVLWSVRLGGGSLLPQGAPRGAAMSKLL